jgi:nucleotide-binding universal stress UspA family protein
MENKVNDVLALVPLTEEGKIVLKQATYLQKVIPYRIFVLNIIPAVSPLKHLFSSRKEKELKDKALKILVEFLKDFYKGEIPENVIPMILMGNKVQTLVRQAQSENFYFMILKRSLHKKENQNLLDQSEIDKIIGHSRCPVLLINEDSTPDNLKNILIPIDISERTEKKLLWASLFAQKNKAKIHIISALKINIEEQKSLASKNANEIQKMLLERGIESEVTVLKVYDKVKHEAVLNYIETKNTDMIIIRKHQVASYENTTIGDFAKEIIHRSVVPVFIVGQSQSDIANILHKHL